MEIGGGISPHISLWTNYDKLFLLWQDKKSKLYRRSSSCHVILTSVRFLTSCPVKVIQASKESVSMRGHNLLERWTQECRAQRNSCNWRKGKWVGHPGLFKQFHLWCSYQVKALLTKPQAVLNRRNEIFWQGKADHKIISKNLFMHLPQDPPFAVRLPCMSYYATFLSSSSAHWTFWRELQ